ncbi:SDR family NAD(P)-dependent oxidoreductase [Nocardia donostiensis]|uniref:Oxidoreductase n=1 Tax=Nocardia donostiensis TaxID=1538463 RepID=A0A1W0AXR1_9NOCA|nr:SDR family NAD(P)-dependent oxidoreductase [Nocardia donostiensis]ONM47624.1 oxidoreductase [Nocardia donostiensis]OQS15031.1 oxidoreductase [Nocardia donostiensis]OQS24204.1 oxidoreductase [Nocardia donostiensis]
MDLRKARVLLTGATGGIGQALAVDLAACSGEVVLTGRRTDVLEPLAEKLNGRAIPADLTDRDAVEQLLQTAGEIDVLVANAALPATGLLSDYSLAEIDRALDVNLRAPIMMAKLLAQHMASRRHGHLVFISSLNGKTASAQASLYNATKFGMRGFALALREDMRPHNVGVSTIFPGYISDAGMFADSGANLPRGIGTRTPQDVARATIRAIEKNRAEVDVAPLSLRMIGLLSGIAPGLSAAIQRRAGTEKITEQLAEGQRSKR